MKILTTYLHELNNLINEPNIVLDGLEINLEARVETIRNKNKLCFLVLRDSGTTIQVVLHISNVPEDDFRKACNTNLESVVLIRGKLIKAKVKSCTINNYELQGISFTVISESLSSGFQINKNFIHPNPETAYDQKYLELRNNVDQNIFKIKSKISQYCQMYLWKNGFTQIQTPKIISTASEGGAEVFKLQYFNRDAYLAQSPQLYKQMAINSEFPRVYEIGPVFRAENSNSTRHLTEFTGVDLEMRIKHDYHEVVQTLWEMIVFVINNLLSNDINVINKINPEFSISFNSDPVIVEYKDAIKMLQESGEKELVFESNLSGTQEKKLGDLVKAKYDTDIFVLDKFPLSLRPFYTQPDDNKAMISRSYDIIIRGMEVLSGAQRIHDPNLLIERADITGVDMTKIQHYIDSFKYGSYPHGGGGFGLERLTMNILGLDNIRKASLFHRDPRRLEP